VLQMVVGVVVAVVVVAEEEEVADADAYGMLQEAYAVASIQNMVIAVVVA
jgi:hypothetical protein